MKERIRKRERKKEEVNGKLTMKKKKNKKYVMITEYFSLVRFNKFIF